jgi:chemotaxis-related protein WspD
MSRTVQIRKVDLADCWNRDGIWGDSSCRELAEHYHCRNCPVYANAALHLLNKRIPADYRREWTDHLAKETKAPPTGTEPILVFRLGDHWMGVATEVVEEITEMSPIHSIPHRSEEVLRGVVNVRGELLICISLGRWFGFHRSIHPDSNTMVGAEERLVVTGAQDNAFVFPVSRVRGIRHFEPDQMIDPGKPDYPVANDFCRGAAWIKDVSDAGATNSGASMETYDPKTGRTLVHILDHQPLFRAISMSLS